MNLSSFGFGITGNLDEGIVSALAPLVEGAGFRTLWVNDTPGGDSLRRIGVAASVASRLQFGTGVIPVDRRPVNEIAKALKSNEVPEGRLSLGIGSSAKPSLTRIAESIAGLRAVTSAPVLVGALGPKMPKLAAEQADGLLLNWLTPEAAGTAQSDKVKDAEGREVKLALYIRTGLGPDAAKRVAIEADRYSSFPSYAANFRRLGFRALDSAVVGDTGDQLADGLRAFERVVDEPVIRAITAHDRIEEYIALIDALVDA